MDEIFEFIWNYLPDNPADHESMGIDYYPARDGRSEPEFYIRTPEGKCFQIMIKEHPHG